VEWGLLRVLRAALHMHGMGLGLVRQPRNEGSELTWGPPCRVPSSLCWLLSLSSVHLVCHS
jgi:hypothetical protein